MREKTAKAVNDAIARLGYVRDLTAANLARSRNYRMAVILPETESQIIQSLAAALAEAGQAAATSRTRIMPNPIDIAAQATPPTLARKVRGLSDRSIAWIFVAPRSSFCSRSTSFR